MSKKVEQALRTVECEIIYHELKRENNFALTESFLEELTEDIDLVIFMFPVESVRSGDRTKADGTDSYAM